MRTTLLLVLSGVLLTGNLRAQDRETKVRADKRSVLDEGYWLYNDLPTAFQTARLQNKPVLVLLRCIPCDNCQGFDRELMKRGDLVRELLEKFVCVRIIKANGLDLARFQYDYDLSSAAFFMNGDGTVYGRYGTRTGHSDGESDVSLEGFAAALEKALAFHKDFPLLRTSLQAKQAKYTGPETPEKFPSLAKYKTELDYDGKVVQSCIHCHQIRDAQRADLRQKGEPFPDDLLYPYPDPAGYGLIFDVKSCTTLASVTKGSPAEKAGLQAGDTITKLEGQPLLSIADVQWVLHHLPVTDGPQPVEAAIDRQGKLLTVRIELPAGWRKQDISWRPTTWELRRMVLGGMLLAQATDEERQSAGLKADDLALRIKHLGEYPPHNIAQQTGLKKGDLIVEFANLQGRRSETEAIAAALRHQSGEKLPIAVLREGKKLAFQLPLP